MLYNIFLSGLFFRSAYPPYNVSWLFFDRWGFNLEVNMFINSLKKKNKLWKTDFRKFAETCTPKELQKYGESIEKKEPKEIDYTTTCWGHTYIPDKHLGNLIHYGYGFHSGGQIIGTGKIEKGDIFLLNSSNGKTGMYQVLHIKFENDPKDMFWAYTACIGHKER